jgi:hypothetical protein
LDERKSQLQGHTEYYVMAIMKDGNRIQLAHHVVGYREIEVQFIELSSDEAILQIFVNLLVSQ